MCSPDIEWKRNSDIIKGYNSATNKQKMIAKNPNPDLVIINAFLKFGEILSICSQDIELKRNSDSNEGGHNSGTNLQKNDR